MTTTHARIELTTANGGNYVDTRTLPAHFNLAGIYMYLSARAEAERIARGNPAYPVTVRAWRVTEAGTYLFPPVAEYTA